MPSHGVSQETEKGMCTQEFSVPLQDTAVGHYSPGAGAGTGINLTVTAGPSAEMRTAMPEQTTAGGCLKLGETLVAEGLSVCAPPETDTGVDHKGTIRHSASFELQSGFELAHSCLDVHWCLGG